MVFQWWSLFANSVPLFSETSATGPKFFDGGRISETRGISKGGRGLQTARVCLWRVTAMAEYTYRTHRIRAWCTLLRCLHHTAGRRHRWRSAVLVRVDQRLNMARRNMQIILRAARATDSFSSHQLNISFHLSLIHVSDDYLSSSSWSFSWHLCLTRICFWSFKLSANMSPTSNYSFAYTDSWVASLCLLRVHCTLLGFPSHSKPFTPMLSTSGDMLETPSMSSPKMRINPDSAMRGHLVSINSCCRGSILSQICRPH